MTLYPNLEPGDPVIAPDAIKPEVREDPGEEFIRKLDEIIVILREILALGP